MKITELRVYVLHASFAKLYGGLERVPMSLRRPAAHFQRIERSGQFSTIVETTDENGNRGWGEAFGLPHPRMSASLIENVIRPALLGLEFETPVGCLSRPQSLFLRAGSKRAARRWKR